VASSSDYSEQIVTAARDADRRHGQTHQPTARVADCQWITIIAAQAEHAALARDSEELIAPRLPRVRLHRR
jgi:hypothetical protein